MPRRLPGSAVSAAITATLLVTGCRAPDEPSASDEYQYEFGDVAIPKASSDEAVRPAFSRHLAERYLEQGTRAWNGAHQCVTCHTNGTYMVTRPALTASLGKPPEATYEFFLESLDQLSEEPPDRDDQSIRPGQVVYIAAGLAEWDRHVSGRLSVETEKALELMFEVQNDMGTWGSPTCWPPYESDDYHKATVAAMAAATAPGWLANLAGSGGSLEQSVERLKTYLQTKTPPHDYAKTLLLRAANRMDGLLTSEQREEIVETLWKHQRADGGWSIRTFARPDAWGDGNRAEKLEAEPDITDPASDGHMTGLAIIALREAGVPANDERISRGLAWLKSNQRVSGRWWTRSLNTDSWHFITYSGTAFALLAFQMCDAGGG